MQGDSSSEPEEAKETMETKEAKGQKVVIKNKTKQKMKQYKKEMMVANELVQV